MTTSMRGSFLADRMPRIMSAWRDGLEKRFGLTIFLLLLGLFLLYEIVTSFVAYTWDAYVAADIVVLSAEVEGRIVAIPVQNNQRVRSGEVLFEIDPTIYRMRLERAQAVVVQRDAQYKAALDVASAAGSAADAARAQQIDAHRTSQRFAQILRSGDITQQRVDDSARDLDAANARLASAISDQAAAQNGVAAAKGAVGQAAADLASAQYDLARTKAIAPVAGTVVPYQVQVGNYLKVGDNAVSMVTDGNWRVVANLEEEYLDQLQVGQPVYVHLTSDFWNIHRGRVRSIARGVARSPVPPDAFPYVPTGVDWVRLQRRYPVEIELEDVDRDRLFAGANASILMLVGTGG